MNILFTTAFMATNTGSEMVIRDLAQGLTARGIRVAVYSPFARGLREIGGAPVFGQVDDLPWVPDLIHGQHAISILPAWRRFPSAPMIQSIQDVNHPLDEPLLLPSIRHYIAVDDTRAQRIRAAGVPQERITLIPNTVALDRFRPKPAHDRIARGLIVAKYHAEFGDLVRRALEPHGVSLDVVGKRSGGMRPDFPELLAGYDLLIGSGRCVLEAAAVGVSAIVCDERGFAGPLTLESWPRLREGNFGLPAFSGPTTPQRLVQALAALDPSEAPRLREVVRKEASLQNTIASLEGLYRRIIEDAAATQDRGATEAPLVDYVLRLHNSILQNMVVREVANGWRTVAQSVERERAAVQRQELEGRASAELLELRQQKEQQEKHLASVLQYLREMQRSTSWRVTGPLRRVMAALRSSVAVLARARG